MGRHCKTGFTLACSRWIFRHMYKSNSTFLLVPHVPGATLQDWLHLGGFKINFQAHLWIQSSICVNPTVRVYLFLAYQGPHCNTGFTLAYLSVWASLCWGVPMPCNAAMPLFCDQSAVLSCTLFHTKKHHSSHKIFASRFTSRCVLA